MKKLLFFVATIVLISLVSCASQQAIEVGAKAGVNIADMRSKIAKYIQEDMRNK